MKKALRERLSRPPDDHSSAVETRNSSSMYTKMTAPVTASQSLTTSSSHDGLSVYSKNAVSATSSHSVAAVSSDLNQTGRMGQRRPWTGSHVAAAGAAVHASSSSSSSSSSLHTSDSSYLTHRPAVTRQFDFSNSATSTSHVHAPTAYHH